MSNFGCIRERIEHNERLILCDKACFSDSSLGRQKAEAPCDIRTCFQRDRDRIIHSKAFRRLKHKTQVFLSPELDHYRTRLTHTLEVAQIARTISRALALNEDLTEAIALAHDLGHTPFGHAGERALDDCSEIGFRHYEQSVRVIDILEKGGKGLNLTNEVRNGVLRHTCGEEADTLEGRIVRLSDRIAYINHDISDAIRAGILCENDIPKEITDVLGHTKSARINTMVNSCISNGTDSIGMEAEVNENADKLLKFLYERVYLNPVAKGEEIKVDDMIKRMFSYYTTNSDKLPSEYDYIREKDGVERATLDYIAGMTDRYAVLLFSEMYIPKSWQK
ncbi:MAG: deoxyguanosinetriphosphate triphosphohydrolase [Acutalibacteraceae bacterium]|nr:deoxyguanosinetriphosphate triphosphohydrolase [Clostridia bacterium]MBQ5597377.1 deoxyguanosinetriphosphate triphosphohydrolase [Clostridia bacterium]MEE1127527.1 deoxyguanosinetriphosphate triphosphohydrolase [Acutalibacteraceae bacterium]